MISTMPYQSLESSDPWIVPSPLEFDVLSDTMPLIPVEAAYIVIQFASPSSDNPRLLTPDAYSVPSWLDSLSSFVDYISHIFPSDEYIMEMLSINDMPWDDNHHQSSFLPPCEEMCADISSISPTSVDFSSSPMLSTSNDLHLVVDMVISSIRLLELDLLTPIVTLDMCFFSSDYLPSSEDLLEAMTMFHILTWYPSKALSSWKP
jgi:hypothetical protein